MEESARPPVLHKICSDFAVLESATRHVAALLPHGVGFSAQLGRD